MALNQILSKNKLMPLNLRNLKKIRLFFIIGIFIINISISIYTYVYVYLTAASINIFTVHTLPWSRACHAPLHTIITLRSMDPYSCSVLGTCIIITFVGALNFSYLCFETAADTESFSHYYSLHF